MVFYGLAAMGKNEFIGRFMEECLKEGINCAVISSDVSQKKAIDKEKERNPDIDHQEAMNNSRKMAMHFFNEMVKEAVDTMKSGRNIIIIEKANNSPAFLANLNKYFKPMCRTKLVAIIPKEEGVFEYHPGNKYVVPFSQGLIANSLYRSIQRGDHTTMQGNSLKKIFLSLSFIKMYDGLRSVKEKKKERIVDEFFEISFIPPFNSDKEKIIPKEFTLLLKKSLRDMPEPFKGDMDICKTLADYVSQEDFEKDFGDIIGLAINEEQYAQIKEFFKIFSNM